MRFAGQSGEILLTGLVDLNGNGQIDIADSNIQATFTLVDAASGISYSSDLVSVGEYTLVVQSDGYDYIDVVTTVIIKQSTQRFANTGPIYLLFKPSAVVSTPPPPVEEPLTPVIPPVEESPPPPIEESVVPLIPTLPPVEDPPQLPLTEDPSLVEVFIPNDPPSPSQPTDEPPPIQQGKPTTDAFGTIMIVTFISGFAALVGGIGATRL